MGFRLTIGKVKEFVLKEIEREDAEPEQRAPVEENI